MAMKPAAQCLTANIFSFAFVHSFEVRSLTGCELTIVGTALIVIGVCW